VLGGLWTVNIAIRARALLMGSNALYKGQNALVRALEV